MLERMRTQSQATLAGIAFCGWLLLSAGATPITKNGFSWDTDNLPTVGTVVSQTTGDLFEFGSGWTPAGWVQATHNTVGDLFVLSGDAVDSSVNVGDGVDTNEIELSWGTEAGLPRGFKNLAGPDIVFYENSGGIGASQEEPYLVSILPRGGSWTGYRYEKPENWSNIGGPTTAMALDVSNFGIAADTWVVAVRVRNPIYNGDSVDNSSGEGTVVLGTAPDGINSFQFQASDNVAFSSVGRFDPDMTIVAPLGRVTIPEPCSIGLLLAGLAAACRRNR